ncbi:MAG: hypothetical protein ABL993_02400 [Vicinamibacterales bacterium]
MTPLPHQQERQPVSTPELFGPTVDYGTPRPSLSRARELVAIVDELIAWDPDVTLEEWPDACRRVVRDARRQGAHSVARVVCWMLDGRTLSRHGYDAMAFRAEDVARRWCARIERAALPTPQNTTQEDAS